MTGDTAYDIKFLKAVYKIEFTHYVSSFAKTIKKVFIKKTRNKCIKYRSENGDYFSGVNIGGHLLSFLYFTMKFTVSSTNMTNTHTKHLCV